MNNDFKVVNPAIVSMPTGTGKTAILATVPFFLASKRVLVIAPDLPIFNQLHLELKGGKTQPMILYKLKILLTSQKPPAVEFVRSPKELYEASLSGRDLVLANVDKFHTKQGSSIWQKHLPQEGFFDLVMVDEAHHLPSAKWRTVVEYFKTARIIFFTATPYRARGGSIVQGLQLPLCNGRIVHHLDLESALATYVVPVDLDILCSGKCISFVPL